jgi:NAD(P)-dependent dehydrogenase (short-subunit alcohol dehydrogenase family)
MIIITGASGGLGSYLVEKLNKDYDIIGTYNTHQPSMSYQRVDFYKVNVCDNESIESFVLSISDRLNKIILINLAGISIDGMGHKMAEETWDQVLDTNLKGTFLMARALLPHMRSQEWGRIINVSSIVGQVGIPGTVAYSASKGGIFSLTRTLAAETAMKNVTVNALALGYFAIGMISVIKPEIQEQIRQSIPMKRFGDPRNVELAIRFLIESDYITGSILNINGGLI